MILDAGQDQPSRTASSVSAPSVAHVLDQVSEAIVVTDALWRIQYMNEAARRLTGANGETIGVPARQCLPLMDDAGQSLFASDGTPRADLRTYRGPLSLCVNDINCPVELRVRPTGRGGWSLVIRDRSHERGLMARLSHQACHDALTGLSNRAAFERFVALAVAAVPEGGHDRPGAVLYLDVDQFKIVNDTSGHDIGDKVLRRVANALLREVGPQDVLARLGGDEFGVLLRHCSVDEARAFAMRLCTVIRDLGGTIDDVPVSHTASIGIAMLDVPEASSQTVLSAADVACFLAKEHGRDRVEVYGTASGPDCQEQMAWVSRVRRACDEQRFVLYHQPIVPLASHTSASRPHFELLIRMVDRSGKIIMPASFIPAAERYNIMPDVDRWTLRHVVTELVWRADRAPQNPYMLSVNLSGTSLRDAQFRRDVLDLLDRHPVAPGTLCFEITETAAVGDIGPVARFMHALKTRGCRFSLDDFGTGMASFVYLKELPVDYLKIDGHFVHQLTRDAASASMVRAFCHIAQAIDVQTVGERVEDAQTARALLDLGVDFAQGFHFEPPRKLLNRLAFARTPGAPLGERVAV